MKTGSTSSLQELAARVERECAAKIDLLASTPSLTMLNAREAHVEGRGEYALSDLAHKQIADERSIPRAFYERLRKTRPGLLDTIVNTLWREEPSRRLVRLLEDRVRAYLSDRYRRLDNAELLEAVLSQLAEVPDLQLASCEVTDARLYLKVVAPRIQGEVAKGDVVQAGIAFSNSLEYICQPCPASGGLGCTTGRRRPSWRGVSPPGVGTSERRSRSRSTAARPSSIAARSSSVMGISTSIRCRFPFAWSN